MYSKGPSTPIVSYKVDFTKSKPKLKIRPPTTMIGTYLIMLIFITNMIEVTTANENEAILLLPPERKNSKVLEYVI